MISWWEIFRSSNLLRLIFNIKPQNNKLIKIIILLEYLNNYKLKILNKYFYQMIKYYMNLL